MRALLRLTRSPYYRRARYTFTQMKHALPILRPPTLCLLCGLNTHPREDRTSLCHACTVALPWLNKSCSRCALPFSSELSLRHSMHIEHGMPSTTCTECFLDPPAFTQSIIPFSYTYPLNRLITRFKDAGDFAAGRLLQDLWLEYYLTQEQQGDCAILTRPDAICAAPSALSTRWHRGFNQAEWLAQGLAAKLGCTFIRPFGAPPALRDQRRLNRRDRKLNAANHFTLQNHWRPRLSERHIAVVDDVVTTGATARQLCELLASADVSTISVFALARTPK